MHRPTRGFLALVALESALAVVGASVLLQPNSGGPERARA